MLFMKTPLLFSLIVLEVSSWTFCQNFGDGVQNPSISNVEANFDCKTSRLIKSINRNNLIESRGYKCNQIKREQQSFELNLLLSNYTRVNITASGSSYIYDYGGIRTIIFSGQVDSTSPYCPEDRIVLYEKALPKKGNCNRGIILHEAKSSFVKVGGVCDSFCLGKTNTQYVRPLSYQKIIEDTYNNKQSDPIWDLKLKQQDEPV